MAQTVIFPKLGQTMEEGAIVKWLKREGDKVARGDILFEIETDKANLEVESFFEGTLLKILVAEGVTVPVNAVVGYVGEPGEKVPDAPPRAPEAGSQRSEARGQSAIAAHLPPPTSHLPPTTHHLPPTTYHLPPSPAPEPPTRQMVSPRARALVRECAISAVPIRGTGPNGRIVENDVRAYLDARHYDALRITPAAKRLAQQKGVDILGVRASGDAGRIMVGDIEREVRRQPRPMSRMRQTIVRRLVESKQTIPHFYVTVTVDVTALLKHRLVLKKRGVRYSLNDFVLAAVAHTLDEFPEVNSRIDGANMAWRGDVDLGMAVSVANGLVVPVIRAAQLLTPAELRDQAHELAAKARAGKLLPDEMTGGGFTVSNMGMLDVDHFTAIINPGESGIVAVGSAREVPVAVKEKIVVRTRMALTLSADHRIVDGALGARFLRSIKAKLEDVRFWRGLV